MESPAEYRHTSLATSPTNGVFFLGGEDPEIGLAAAKRRKPFAPFAFLCGNLNGPGCSRPGAEFQHHFHPGMDVKLFVDLLQMPAQGQDGHAEAAGDFFVGQTADDQL